jgi:GH15 family glucan-1,4-alpha-glucosidase
MPAEVTRIQDYAIIGNGRSAALISKRGSLDWLCWPRFDSPSVFGAILDPKSGGHWSIRALHESEVRRRYIENTNVLETTFLGPNGEIVLTDFMAVTSEENKRRALWPEHELVRQIKCRQGEVEVVVDFSPRLDYGRVAPNIRDAGKFGWRIDTGANVFILRGSIDLEPTPDRLAARFALKSGESVVFTFSFSDEAPAVVSPLGSAIDEKLTLAIDWWRSWAAQSTYRGPYQRQVTRSALVLKLLSYAPSGTIIAAPTTSLPERIGGDLNWDYRFAWVRDASFTVHALFGLGYKDDAAAFVDWLLHTTRLTSPKLRVMYDVYGELPPPEHFLSHLEGHRKSQPVRVGNAASEQQQLDVYGELVEAVSHFFGKTEKPDRDVDGMLRGIGKHVCEHWRESDNGIWEERDELRPYTHSRLMCWVALDRLLQMHARGQIRRLDVTRCAAERENIRKEIEQRAWNPQLAGYTQACGSDIMDATVLLFPYHGFESATSQRMRESYTRVRERLVPRRGLVYRYEQSKERHEGAFAVCSFWEVDFLVRSGKLAEAREVFEAALGYANDVDLFAEQIEPHTGEAMGNFPQAFTHLGVINSVLALDDRAAATH